MLVDGGDGREAGSASLLVLRGLSKSFGPVEALRQVDLELRRGEFLGLIGHNGAGKTTLMNILMGVVHPDQGDFLLEGEAITGPYSPAKAHGLGIRCVFQELSLCPNLSAVENMLVIHPALGGVGWERRAKALIAGALAEIFPGHTVDVHRPVADLPIGYRQMIEIARAFTESDAPAKVVILDEPTSSLDSTAAEQLLEFLGRAVQNGRSCILITHKLNEVLNHARRVVVMKDARVVADVPASGLSREGLFELMGAVERAPSAARRRRLQRPATDRCAGRASRNLQDADRGRGGGGAGGARRSRPEGDPPADLQGLAKPRRFRLRRRRLGGLCQRRSAEGRHLSALVHRLEHHHRQHPPALARRFPRERARRAVWPRAGARGSASAAPAPRPRSWC